LDIVVVELLVLMAASACASPRPSSSLAAPSSLAHVSAARLGDDRPREEQDADEPTGVLTLGQATARALARNPELAALSLERRAREEAVVQASARPNPFLEASVEDFAGTGAGARAVYLARGEYEARRNVIRGQVAQAYLDVLRTSSSRTG
jgi:outer membrane protein TolC